ncbi:hypothetical protein ER308_08745 [Egibacter rhizosphaerae]|uniref:Helicase C-terminal domain-containing protein n=1 Tax=Egibacter rhizosphaerae TaxID=1670831 RepID=A0A411YEK7_9ACTN|nr:helicase C-terminal domain-containing protein [Egibacter rhizosphaerae]QBI19630.1 hypothetical protein ER308_08745 [Egibacter rhizosphaerae]
MHHADSVHPDFGPAATATGGAPHPGQRPENAAEGALVDHVLGVVATELTDRAGGRHAPPWDPKQQVRVGVLRPQVRPPREERDGQPRGDASDDEEDDERLDVNHEPLALGLDFAAQPDQPTHTAPKLTLAVDVRFALYQPLLPAREEMARHVREQAAQHDATDGASDEGDEDGGRRPTRVPVPHAWLRTDVEALDLPLTLTVDGSHTVERDAVAAAARDAVEAHYRRADAARPFTSARTVAVRSLDGDAAWTEAARERTDPQWTPDAPRPEVVAFAEPLPDGRAIVSVSLVNRTQVDLGAFQDLALYDCRVAVRPRAGARVVRQRFSLASEDYRYAEQRDVIGHGRNCVAAGDEQELRSETLPRHVQRIVRPRTDHVPGLRWAALATDPQPVLGGVEDAMRDYLAAWDRFLAEATFADTRTRDDAEAERAGFAAELERFALGRQLLRTDSELRTAFTLANQAFDHANAADPQVHSWRLFQLVYIVSQLPGLAARCHRNDPQLRAELDSADVLWFPTGGGKTEAYLGLVLAAAFYDRLRGKHAGVTAWLRFPLRMLSVQQLARVLDVLVAADRVREEQLDGLGAPFELGYLVGSTNTPNQLQYESRWWPGIDRADELTEEDKLHRRLVAACPHCGDHDGVRLEPDPPRVRILHRCKVCDTDLPIHMSDDEVYRYQPTVLVSTTDKITGFSHFGEFTSLNWGPAKRCPDHGYFTYRCLAGNRCERATQEMAQVDAWPDPVPALVIQDELHLVREELGTFAAHYDGLLAELQRSGPSQLPSKMLAATATIEQYEDQLRQVYGRHPRRFPSPGFEAAKSFYTAETPDVRRVFLGLMPTGGGTTKVEVAGKVQSTFVRVIAELQDDLPAAQHIIERRCGQTPTANEALELLFQYEVSLGYVNNRGHGASIADDLRELSRTLEERHREPLLFDQLTGDVPIGQLAAAIDQVEDADPSTARGQRLRALVGTSVVSHGVDISRLNLMVMTGLPTTIADYIQATSRAGRSHVGAVVTVFDHFARREASSFAHFDTAHRFLDHTVEPVPVNKYARNAVDRTLPGLAMALLWDMTRDPANDPPEGGIRRVRNFRPWWEPRAAILEPVLRDRLERAYRAVVATAVDRTLEDQLVERALDRWDHYERNQMVTYEQDNTKELFLERVMENLRDVDEAVGFDPWPRAGQIYEALLGQRGT